MTAHKRISRNEERNFSAAERATRKDRAANFTEELRDKEREQQDWQSRNRTKRGFN